MRVFDEDTKNELHCRISIGDTSAPPPVILEPKITAYQQVLPSGQARLDVWAEDATGLLITESSSYTWDFDSDDQFDDAVGSSVLIDPGTGFHPFVAVLRVFDAKGRMAEGLFAFGGDESKKPR